MARKLNVGLIGVGVIGVKQLESFLACEDAKVVAVADVREDVARSVAQQYDIPKVFTDYRELLDVSGLDAVSVCTPPFAHAEPTCAAAKKGKHVLCEKPMEATLDAASRMVRAAHETGKILMIALKLRFSPQVMVAKRIVDEGTLGDIYYAECVADRRRGNPGGSFVRKATAGFGAGADIGVYALDTALYLMGHPKPVAVAAITSNYISLHSEPVIGQWGRNIHETEVEDFAAAWVRFDNGARLVFKTSWCMHLDSMGGTFFLGTRAGLRVGVGEVRGPGEGVWVYRDEFGALTNVTVEGVRSVEGIELFRRENAAFAEAVREGQPSPIDPDGMLLTNVIIQGVMDSADAGGKEVEVSVPMF